MPSERKFLICSEKIGNLPEKWTARFILNKGKGNPSEPVYFACKYLIELARKIGEFCEGRNYVPVLGSWCEQETRVPKNGEVPEQLFHPVGNSQLNELLALISQEYGITGSVA